MCVIKSEAYQWVVAVEQGLYEQRVAGLIKADGHVCTQALAQNQHGLEVLQVEGDIAGFKRIMLIVQKDLMCVHR